MEGALPSREKDATATLFYENTSAKRIYTDAIICQSLRRQYPNLPLQIVPRTQGGYACDLISFVTASDEGSVTPLTDNDDFGLVERRYAPPTNRDETGSFTESIVFGKYIVKWKGKEFLLYIVDTRDGSFVSALQQQQFVLGAEPAHLDSLIKAIVDYQTVLHDEIWVFDSGYWSKSKELYASVMKAGWDKVILEDSRKEALRQDVARFFNGKDKYLDLQVPWKRGVIYYGPPGNGKTVSIKALMKELYQRKTPVPTLYVRSLSSFGGPESSVKLIFSQARQEAPCLLVFEDLDSFVTDEVKSYFFNEIDGLQTNDGVLIVGSTNYLERLDPGISKRPSRFDRKFDFPKPDLHLRTKYCEFWRNKLKSSNVDYPSRLSPKIAKITDNFSFAYIQEAFVASLLAIAARHEKDDEEKEVEDEDEEVKDEELVYVSEKNGGDDTDEDADLEKLELWREIQEQVKLLKDEM